MNRSLQYRECHSKPERLARPPARPLSFISSILAIACLWACGFHPDPQAAFDHALQTFKRGDIVMAMKLADEGYRRFHGLGAAWAWKFTILKARALALQGMNDRALALLSSEPSPPSDGDLAVQKLRLEGVAYSSEGKFPDAERALRQADRLCANSEFATCGDILRAWGFLEMHLGHYPQAEEFFERALAVAHTRGDLFLEATAYLNLSFAADVQGHFDEALDWANLIPPISIPQHFDDISQAALGNMGWAYYKLGDSEKARDMFLRASAQAESLGDTTDRVKWITNAAYTYMDSGKSSAAEQSFQQSLKLAQQINSREDIINSLIALAFVSERTNKLDDATRYAGQALARARADSSSRDAVYPRLVQGRIAARRNDTTGAEAAFQEVAQSPDAPVFLKWEAERSLAHMYEDEKQFGPADAGYRTALTTFEKARCGVHERVDSRLPFLSNAARIYEDYIHFLVTQGKTDEALRVADYTRARTLTEGLERPCKATFAPDPLNVPVIARRAGGTILFYALGQEHSYLWVITPQQTQMFPLTANQNEIDEAVQHYRKQLEGEPEILETSNYGSVLYQMLVAPAQDFLKQALAKNGNIFIVPDGGLNSLNFETLEPQPKRYWIEDVTIANAASLRLLPGAHDRGNLAGKLLLVGNPVVPQAGTDNSYPELPYAAKQMEGVQKHFPSARREVFTQQQASPASYLNHHPEQFSYIHFVAHGTASRENPLDSAIILAPESNTAAAQDDSFKLYARDIIGTQPLQAKLVTISACYSTGKRTYSGEGLVGLSWAFLRAGAHNVIAALWDVSDASTAQLMDRVYEGIEHGQSPEAALRAAKLSLLHSNDAVHKPFYWAPFQLYTGR
jgi:CHAT domain-containing protein